MKKKLLFLILLLVSTTAISQGNSNQTTEKLKKLNWLAGTWTRTNAKPGRSGIEQWELTSSNELRGLGINLRGKDTTFVEKLRIIIKDENIVYVADVPENQKSIYFKLTEITDSGFTFENPTHDFPKKIAYHLDGKKLKAQISGDGKVVDYLREDDSLLNST